MDADSTCQLGNTCYRKLYLLAGCHDEVAKLVDDNNDVRHILVTIGNTQSVVHKLSVIFLDVLRTSLLQEVVAGIHKFTETVQCTDNLRNVGDDSFLFAGLVRHLCHKVVYYRSIDAELHLLRVDEYELQLVRMFLVEQRGDDGVKTDRLTLTGSTSNEQVRNLCQIDHKHFVGDSLSECYRQRHIRFLELTTVEDALHRYDVRLRIRHLDTYCSLAGNRSDDTYSKGCKRQGDVVLEVTDLCNLNTRSRSNLVEGDGRTDGSCDRAYLNTEVAKNLDDAVLVLVLLFHIDVRLSVVLVFLQEVESRILIFRPRLLGVDRCREIYLADSLAVGFLFFATCAYSHSCLLCLLCFFCRFRLFHYFRCIVISNVGNVAEIYSLRLWVVEGVRIGEGAYGV